MSMWTNLFGTEQAKKKKKTANEYSDDVKDEEPKKVKKCKPKKRRTLPVAIAPSGSRPTKQRQRRTRPNPVRYLYV